MNAGELEVQLSKFKLNLKMYHFLIDLAFIECHSGVYRWVVSITLIRLLYSGEEGQLGTDSTCGSPNYPTIVGDRPASSLHIGHMPYPWGPTLFSSYKPHALSLPWGPNLGILW
jgi:hypothetical protein